MGDDDDVEEEDPRNAAGDADADDVTFPPSAAAVPPAVPEPDERAEEQPATSAAATRAPAPEAQPAAGGQDAAFGGTGLVTGIELDQMWSDITDALQGRHLPTYSILTTCAFPVSFEKNDLVIGVRKEGFQKMIENKAEHVKNAFLAVSGKTITVRVKVIADDGFSAPAKRPAAASTSSRESRPKPAASDPEGDRGSHRPSSPSRDDSSSYSSPSHSAQSAPRDNAATATAERSEAPPPRPSAAAAAAAVRRAAANVSDDGGGPSMIGDAYKIFEGPGSRLLQ